MNEKLGRHSSLPLLVAFEGVSLGYGRHVVLEEVNLEVRRGDFLGIVGPNGSGKTTLVRALLGMLKPIRGKLTFHVSPNELKFGYVPQRESLDELYPLTVLDIVLMSRIPQRGLFRPLTKEDKRTALWSLEQAGIAELADVPYRLLSGGQKQRTLVARALAASPNVLVLDEPTNGLDLPAEHDIMQLISRLHLKQGITVILVTHLLNVVLNYASRLAILHEGRLRVGAVDEIISSQSLRQAYGIEADVGIVNGYKVVVARRGS